MAATTTPRKPRSRPAAVKPTPRSVIDAGHADDVEPLRFTAPAEIPAEDRVTIAYLDEYALTMPRTLPPNVALKLMRTSRKQGTQAAMGELLEEVLGEDAYTRLADYPHLTDDGLADLIKVVQTVAMGRLETPKASSRNG